MPPLIADHLHWWVAGVIVVVGLFVLGIKDVARFSFSRVWAISSVCFAESIRRRVWLIPPLAILGVIIVSQLQKPIDEQDAVLQTIKFCLFATGLVVVIATIILAATSLPREIENRVIYTIVTKPTTRLEVVLGKVVGFARVSGLILIIMGLFTWGYLNIRAWGFRQNIQDDLDAGRIKPESVATMTHYAQPGALLEAKTLREPDRLDVYARLPEPGDAVRWSMGMGEQDVLVPFDLTRSQLIAPGDPSGLPGGAGLAIFAHVQYEQRAATADEIREAPPGEPVPMQPPPGMPGMPGMPQPQAPATAPAVNPMMMSIVAVQDTRPAEAGAAPGATSPSLPTPRVSFGIVDQDFYSLVSPRDINGGKAIEVVPPDAPEPITKAMIPPPALARLVERLGNEPTRLYVQIQGITPGVTYGFKAVPAILAVPDLTTGDWININPVKIKPPNDGQQDAVPLEPFYRGRIGTHGQQLRGPTPQKEAPVAVYRFRGAELPGADQVPFELRAGIERSGSEAAAYVEDPTELTVQIRNLATNQISQPVSLRPESNRRVYFSMPSSAVEGGNFDVILRTLTPGHYVGLWTPPAARPTLMLVSDQQGLAWNLFKSLFIMWLLTILVVIVALFASTFLSWPIAIVLTLVILLGRWGVEQIGDAALSPGIGNQVATELGFRGAGSSKVVSESVENLSKFLRLVSAVLPDISRFPAMEQIEKGMTVSPASIGGAFGVLLGYGLPMLVLAYVFLKNKEVAP